MLKDSHSNLLFYTEKIKIIGKSGSGKSTLIKTICGLNTAFEGSVEINCLPVNEENAVKVRELISYMRKNHAQ